MSSLRTRRRRRSEIHSAGSAEETLLKHGSQWEADCAANSLDIVRRRTFSESSRSVLLKVEGDSRGTPTMFLEIFDVERVGGVRGRSADRV